MSKATFSPEDSTGSPSISDLAIKGGRAINKGVPPPPKKKMEGGGILKRKLKMLLNIVIILDGYSEIGGNVQSEIGNFICFRHLYRSKAVANLKLISEKSFFPSYVRKKF